jgi:hypothetical protein
VQDPLGPLEVIATNPMWRDPAIDMSEPAADADGAPSAEERLAKYRETRDRAVLVLKPDVAPTLFVCKPLPAVFVQTTLAGMSPHARALFAFVAGCHLVKLPNGGELKAAKLQPSAYGTSRPDEHAWIETITRKFGMDTVTEIGDVIFARARLPEGAPGPFPYRAG